MSRFAQGKYTVVNPDKYVGNRPPTYRSSWEWQFMRFCDTDTRILKWASEAVKIPYKDPFTGNRNNQLQYAKNQIKWRAAYEWCARQGIKFRILTEQELFHRGGKR